MLLLCTIGKGGSRPLCRTKPLPVLPAARRTKTSTLSANDPPISHFRHSSRLLPRGEKVVFTRSWPVNVTYSKSVWASTAAPGHQEQLGCVGRTAPQGPSGSNHARALGHNETMCSLPHVQCRNSVPQFREAKNCVARGPVAKHRPRRAAIEKHGCTALAGFWAFRTTVILGTCAIEVAVEGKSATRSGSRG